MSENTFEQQLRLGAEKAILKIVTEGNWVQPDYANRFKLPASFMDDVWKLVDQQRLMELLKDRIEAEVVDKIVNAIAAELSTDIKQILSMQERREAIRSIARQHMQSIMQKGVK